MNARARRRAFLLGCNSGGLEHCECDAKLLRDTLRALGYDAETFLSTEETKPPRGRRRKAVPSSVGVPTDAVTAAVRGFMQGARRGDTILVYFSGHSRFEYNRFHLLVGDDPGNPDHLLDVTQLIGLCIQPGPAGVDFLLILDCCQAAAADTNAFWNNALKGLRARVWVPAREDSYAWELAGPTGGGLTRWFIEALTEAAPGLAAKGQGYLTLHHIDRFVQDQAKAYRSPTGRTIPIPGVCGFTADDILLAEWATDFPPSAQAELVDLFRASGLAPTAWHAIYEDLCECAGLSVVDDYRGPIEAARLTEAVANLAAAWYRPFPGVTVPLPLAEFVERIAQTAPNAPDLRAWLRRGLQDLARGQDLDAFIERLNLGRTASPAAKPRPRSHLAIALCPREKNRATHYSIEARLVDRQGRGNPVGAPPDLAPAASMPTILRTLFRDDAVKVAKRCPQHPLTIEFFLPIGLLGTEVDDWTTPRPSSADPPLSGRYPVTVRALDRLCLAAGPEDDDAEPWIADWHRQWTACAGCREHEQDGLQVPACCVWVPQPRKFYQTLARDGGCIFVLGFRPDGDQLGLMLRSGLAVVLWGSEPLAEDFPGTLIAEVARTHPNSPKRACLADLPLALLHLRQDAWEQDQGHTGGYHLLWDDPERLPQFTGRPAPTATAGPPTPILQSPY